MTPDHADGSDHFSICSGAVNADSMVTDDAVSMICFSE
jgi:hypothetical protein